MTIIEQQLKVLEEKLLDPAIRKSTAELNKLLADNFIEFSKSGHIYNKQQIIDALLLQQPIQQALTDFKVTYLKPDVMLVTYRAIQQQTIYSLRSSIWQLINDCWQIVFHQGTLIS